MSDLETLLRASITIEQQRKEIEKLKAQNEKLRRENGKLRLLADIRHDIREARRQAQ